MDGRGPSRRSPNELCKYCFLQDNFARILLFRKLIPLTVLDLLYWLSNCKPLGLILSVSGVQCNQLKDSLGGIKLVPGAWPVIIVPNALSIAYANILGTSPVSLLLLDGRILCYLRCARFANKSLVPGGTAGCSLLPAVPFSLVAWQQTGDSSRLPGAWAIKRCIC